MKTLGGNIRLARRARGMTQKVLHQQVGISQVHLSLIENDRSAPGLRVVARIADVLDLPIEALLRGTDKYDLDLFAP